MISVAFSEALRRAPHYADLAIGWFEKPLPGDDLEGHRRLAAQATLPIADGRAVPPETPGLGIAWDWPEIEYRAKFRHLIT